MYLKKLYKLLSYFLIVLVLLFQLGCEGVINSSDIDFEHNVSHLKSLSIENNPINNFAFLNNFKNLELLYISPEMEFAQKTLDSLSLNNVIFKPEI